MCLLLHLALATLPLALTPKLGLQLTKYRCGFLPNTTQKQGSQLQKFWLNGPRTWCYSNIILTFCFLFSVFLKYTADITPNTCANMQLHWLMPPSCLSSAPCPSSRALLAIERVWCGERWLWYHSQAEEFECRPCTLQLCGLRQSPCPFSWQHPSSVKWKH